MKSLVISVLISQIAFTALAGTTTVVQCPTPHPRYTEILKRLESIASSFKESAECKAIGAEVDELLKKYRESNRNLLEPGKKLGLSKINERQELTVEEANSLSEYSQDVTSSVGAIVEKLTNSPRCLNEKNTPVLTTVADIVQETTGIASQYTGPYGIAIAVGGTAIGGILRGISVLQERYNDGFDFRERDKRKLFVSNICSYHNARVEIEDIINPENRITSVDNLKVEMEQKRLLFLNTKADLNGDGSPDNCELCRDLDIFYEAQQVIKRAFSSSASDLMKIREALNIEGKEWDTCIRIGGYVEDVDPEDLDFGKSGTAEEEFAQVKEAFAAIKTIPGIKDCMKLQRVRNIKDVNNRSVALIDYLSSTSQAAFKKAFSDTVKLGQKKYVEELKWDYNPVDYMAHTLTKIDWADDQSRLIKELSNGGSAQIQREINEINLYLRERFFENLAPRFLEWHEDDVDNAVSDFEKVAKRTATELSETVLGKSSWFSRTKADQLPSIIEAIVKKPDADHGYVFSLLNSLMLVMNTAKKSGQAIGVYCQFFADSYTMTKEINRVCNKQKRDQVRNALESQNQITSAVESYVAWAIKENKIPLESVDSLLKRVRQFREKIKILP